METPSWQADQVMRPKIAGRGTFAFRTLLVFSIVYFARPEDIIPGLGYIPVAKISGGLALLGIIFGVGSRFSINKLPAEMRLVAALFIWECLAVPFAWYHSGAMSTVINLCSKTVLTVVLIGLVVDRIDRLRKLLFVHAASVAVMTFVSVLLYRGGRMGGVLGGVFDNPNDLAVNIAMSWPICLMFLLRTRNPFKKLLWALAMVIMVRGLMLTYSRTGFLALGMATLFCVTEFGLREKRYHLIALAAAGILVAALVAPAGYGTRMGSIFGKPLDVGDSQGDRENLLKLSLMVTARHPLLGIGPGNFQGYTQTWRVSHNTYTQLTSECGIPALVIFILFLAAAFRNLKNVRKSTLYAENPEVRLFTAALGASLAGYVVGAFFASTAYELFPYFLVGYTTALYKIASLSDRKAAPAKSPLQNWTPSPQLLKMGRP